MRQGLVWPIKDSPALQYLNTRKRGLKVTNSHAAAVSYKLFGKMLTAMENTKRELGAYILSPHSADPTAGPTNVIIVLSASIY